jgi:hypothetical protein
VFKTVVTTEYSRGARESFGDATSEVATLDFNKVRRFDIEDGDSPNVVIEGSAWMCKQGGCQDLVKIGVSAPRQEEARAIESKRHAIDFIKKACPGPFLVDRPQMRYNYRHTSRWKTTRNGPIARTPAPNRP